MKKTLFMLFCLLCSIGAMAQKKTITGVVTDATGEAVIGASIVETGTTNGTVTDLDGNFTLSVANDGSIRVSFVGYQTQTLSVKGKSTFKIALKEDSEMLQEVVVTGYGGKQLRTKVTNSISKVKEETLKQGLYSNPAQALSGAVAGLSVSQTSGNPGAAPTLVLRGGTNFDGSGSPLILVDGQVRGSLSDINPADIESMEVLKDAGATAIYGARANDGVVLVTTKRGKEGSTRVELSAKLGWNYFHNSYNFMNARDYIYWMRTGYMNAYTGDMKHPDGSAVQGWSSLTGLTGATPYGTGNKYWADDDKTIPLNGNENSQAIWSTMKYSDDLAFLLNQGWETMTDPIYGDQLIFKNTDIADFNINSPSFSQDYNLSVSGGNEKGNYYAGLGYNHSEGTAVGNKYQRITFTFNADYKLKPWLTSNSSFNFADATWNDLPPTQSAEANYFSRVLSLPPTFRGYNADGEMLLGPNSGDGNQQINFDKFVRDNNTDKFTMNQSFTADIMKGMHKNLKEGVFEDMANGYAVGDWKKRVNVVGTITTAFPQEVPAMMESLLAEYTGKKKVELRDIAKFHAAFERIHPFQDGNGRVGRMVLLKQCLDADITPVIIRDENKIKYYRCLSAAQSEHDYSPLIDFFESEQKWYQEKVIPMIFDYDELQ